MALVIGGKATVATGMSLVAEGALYADPIFIDGVTFTSKHSIGNAGQIQVVKYGKGASALEPKVPGSNFTDEDYSNTVLEINCNNAFQKSVKVPSYYGATMPLDVQAEKTIDVTLQVSEGRQASGLAVLADEGTIVEDTTVITADNVKKIMLTNRMALRKKNAKPNVVLCNVETYSAVLEAAGKDFTPMYNDSVVRQGKVGYWLGMYFIEATLLDGTSTYKYMQANGTPKAVDISKVQFIMYDFNAFTIIDRLDTLRILASEMFSGEKVQEELSVGMLVTNKDCVLVKKKQ